jgi:selenide,water dikinase
LAVSVKLTAMVKAAGCAAKLSPGILDSVLRRLPRPSDPNVLVGFSTNDDAGIYQLAENLALVQTADFFTPIVDDPFAFGQIAATNALSDVYAMGGSPISALSLVGFPEKGEPAILEQIIRGGLNKMDEAKCTVIGGHSIRNDDILFGYAVIGKIDPRKVWRNVGARAGDVLLFTKSIGTGVLSTALKNNRISQISLDAAIASMCQLNCAAADALHQLESFSEKQPIHTVTDVTGFGLLGHSREMALGDSSAAIEPVTLEIHADSVLFLPGALEAAREGMLSGGLKNNREFLGDCVSFASNIAEDVRALLFDPQTSGGLLVSLDPSQLVSAVSIFARHGVTATNIGRVLPKTSPILQVV